MLSFFFLSDDVENQENDLGEHIMKAILSDCDSTMQAVNLAVQWDVPAVVLHQLEESKEADPDGLSRAFQTALSLRNEEVVKILLRYNADALASRVALWEGAQR